MLLTYYETVCREKKEKSEGFCPDYNFNGGLMSGGLLSHYQTHGFKGNIWHIFCLDKNPNICFWFFLDTVFARLYYSVHDYNNYWTRPINTVFDDLQVL